MYVSTSHYCSLIDSSEMVDTYGAALDEVRGFVLGGWEACGNHEGLLHMHMHTYTHTQRTHARMHTRTHARTHTHTAHAHAHTHTHTLIHCLFLTGDISDKGRLFRVSTSHFAVDLLPCLTSHDAVICLCSSDENASQLQEIMEKLVTSVHQDVSQLSLHHT